MKIILKDKDPIEIMLSRNRKGLCMVCGEIQKYQYPPSIFGTLPSTVDSSPIFFKAIKNCTEVVLCEKCADSQTKTFDEIFKKGIRNGDCITR